MLCSATEAVSLAEDKAVEAVDRAMSGSPSQFERIQTSIKDALKCALNAQEVIAQAGNMHQGTGKSEGEEATLEHLSEKAKEVERKCRVALNVTRIAFNEVLKVATKKLRALIHTTAQDRGSSVAEVVHDIACGQDVVSEDHFSKFIALHVENSSQRKKILLAFRALSSAPVQQNVFLNAIQEFYQCEQDVNMTSECGMDQKHIRAHLCAGELIELLEGPKYDSETELTCIRGRRLQDGCCGWVELENRDVSSLLKSAERPRMCCTADTPLNEGFNERASPVRQLHRDEIVELLEGPKHEVSRTEVMLFGRLSSDGTTGWISLRDAEGVIYAAQNTSVYVCRKVIALTDAFDIKGGSVVRRVNVGETFELMDGKAVEEPRPKEAIRLKLRAVLDGKEGWITVKGSQGTVFLEPVTGQYLIERSVPLRSGPHLGDEVLMQLGAGDRFEALDAPKEECLPARIGYKVRALDDGVEGWVSHASDAAPVLCAWTRKYLCKMAVPLTSDLECRGVAAVHRTEPGAVFEAIEGPKIDDSSCLRRVLCATDNDGVVGWATLRGPAGEVFLQHV